MRATVVLAVLAAGCNSFLGVDDVTLRPDGGPSADGALADAAPPDAAPDAALPTRIGNDTEFGGLTDIPAGFDVARQVVLTDPGTLVGFGVITKAAGGAGGKLRMGLYENLAATNEPGNFKARSAVISDFPTGETIAEISGVPLEAGTYWVAIAFNNDTSVGADGTATVRNCFASRSSFDTSIPTAGFDTPTCNDSDQLNLFILVANE